MDKKGFRVGISSDYVVVTSNFPPSLFVTLCLSRIPSVGLRLKILQTIVLSTDQLIAGAPRRCLCQRGEPRLHLDATSVSADCSCGTRHVWLLLGTSLAEKKKRKRKAAQGRSPRSVWSTHTYRAHASMKSGIATAVKSWRQG